MDSAEAKSLPHYRCLSYSLRSVDAFLSIQPPLSPLPPPLSLPASSNARDSSTLSLPLISTGNHFLSIPVYFPFFFFLVCAYTPLLTSHCELPLPFLHLSHIPSLLLPTSIFTFYSTTFQFSFLFLPPSPETLSHSRLSPSSSLPLFLPSTVHSTYFQRSSHMLSHHPPLHYFPLPNS